MIWIALALLQSAGTGAVAPVDRPEEATEVTVTADRLRKLQLDLAVEMGRVRSCGIKVSSGDRFIDDVACQQARVCVPQMKRVNLMSCINTTIGLAVAQKRSRDEERTDAKD